MKVSVKKSNTASNPNPSDADATQLIEKPSQGYTERMRAVMEQTSRQPAVTGYSARQKAVQEYTARINAQKLAAEEKKKKKRKRIGYGLFTAFAVLAVLALAIVLKNINDQREYNDYYSTALQYYYASDLDNALVYLRKAAACDETEECLKLAAECYSRQGNYDKAIEVLRMLDTTRPEIAAQISAIEEKQEDANRGETVTIGGKPYPITTTSLVLDGLWLGDNAMIQASQLYSLVNLSAAENGISSVSSLAVLGGLNTLNLSGNSISDISPLSALTALRTLYLDNNPIQDFTPLYSLTNLTTLSIKGVEITEKQLSELSNALPNCAIHSEKATQEIAEISIGGNTFRSDIAELDLSGLSIVDISALSNCKSLTRLNISNNDISDLSPLMDIPGLRWLDFSGNNVSDLRPLMGMTALTYINAADNNVSSTVALGALTGLKELYLDNNRINDFTGLKKLKALETLSLNNSGLTDDGLNSLARLTSLRLLYIEDNEGLTAEIVDALKAEIPECYVKHSDLIYSATIGDSTIRNDETSLDLSGMGLENISDLSSFTSLEWLDLSDNRIVSVYPLAYCTQLTSLDLSNNLIKDVSPLVSLTSLKVLNLSNNEITSITALTEMTWLEELHIDGNDIPESEYDKLFEALPECTIYVY